MTTIAPYGTWTSPITAQRAAAAGGGPGWVQVAGGRVWWAEDRPTEGGRVTIVCAAPGERPADVLPPGWNARNRVHEYGGKPFTVVGDALVFTHWDDQRLYVMDGDEPRPITPAPRREHGLRYADPVPAPSGHQVWCVRETITGDAPTDVRRDVVAVLLDPVPLDAVPVAGPGDDPPAVRVLAASHHFMTTPRPSPDGRHAAWIGWNHPAMPWDGTELCVADVTPDGGFGPHRVIAGGPSEAVCQVEWDSDDGSLLAMTDPDGWWNLYRIDLRTGHRRNLDPVAEELGGALWRLGLSWFAPLGGGRYAVLRTGRLAVLDERSGLADVPCELDWWWSSLSAENGRMACTAGGPQRETAVVHADLSAAGQAGRTAPASPPPVIVELTQQPPDRPDAALLPRPVELTFTAADGAQVPAYVYPPTNPSYSAPDGERPPYIVQVHGGPTGRSLPLLDMDIAYFTSRGFGVVAPNYGGSTGNGRAYRERLRERWGIVDVADCATVALALAADGAADRDRMVVRGGSAGGWTAVVSMTAGPAADGAPVYRCGAAHYPVIDLTQWTAATHDFESRYLDSLVGPLPQARQRYVERSPVNSIDRVSGPILLLQGLDDRICPPAQAQRLRAALAGSGIPHAYLSFDGEQHGFRMAQTIETALAAELSFFGQVLGFDPPGVERLELSS